MTIQSPLVHLMISGFRRLPATELSRKRDTEVMMTFISLTRIMFGQEILSTCSKPQPHGLIVSVQPWCHSGTVSVSQISLVHSFDTIWPSLNHTEIRPDRTKYHQISLFLSLSPLSLISTPNPWCESTSDEPINPLFSHVLWLFACDMTVTTRIKPVRFQSISDHYSNNPCSIC